MPATIQGCTLELMQGDITLQDVDAIVNAANSRLAGGGGVDGAIHRRGGPAILQETSRRYPAGCLTGTAVITGAGQLSAKYVIHAVGPIWTGGQSGEPDLLARAIRLSLELAVGHECQSIAIPAISAGSYGYPMDLAAEVALQCVREFLTRNGRPKLVRFVLFDEPALQTFQSVAKQQGFSTADGRT